MKRRKGFVVMVLIAVIALVGMHLTIHSGELNAEVPGDSNMRGRYQTESTTPITDLNTLNGVNSNVQDQLDATTSSSLADTKAYIGNSAGLAVAQNISLVNDIVGTMDNSGVINGAIPASTITSAMIAIANVQSSDIQAAAVNSPKLDKYTLDLLVANTATTNTVTGDASDLYTGYLLTTVGGINGSNLVNDLSYDGLGNYTISMVNALAGGDAIWTLGFINSN